MFRTASLAAVTLAIFSVAGVQAADLKPTPKKADKPQGPKAETLPPVRIAQLRADKLIYQPGEAGCLRVRVLNTGPTEARGKLVTILSRELADNQTLPEKTLTIPARGETAVEIPFTATGRWGTAARVELLVGETRHVAEDYFSVTDNFFEVGIGYGTIQSTAVRKVLTTPEKARAAYANWMELLFWAPCDWSLLVAPEKQWWSGQASYPEDEDNLKELLARCHADGIKVAMYASGNAAGPFGWELARRKPAWFGGGSPAGLADVAILDKWNDPDWRKIPRKGKLPWYRVNVDLRRLDALDWGIDQLIDSVTHYGWDAVRFDGHYTIPGDDELSTRNMRRLKERVWAAHPRFRLGFNYGRAPEWLGGISHEMREAMAGGGQYIQEGIRGWRYTNDRYQSWHHYATNELRIARQIQALGGSYHAIWDLQSAASEQALYKLVYGLIAGGHPSYDLSHPMPAGYSSWGAFMTRWSAMLWDPALVVLPRPKEQVSVEGNGLQWESFVQERVQSPERKYVIIHLVNPPQSDDIASTKLPTPRENINACYRPKNGTRVSRVVLVRPEASPWHTELTARPTDKGLCVSVPQVQTWAMVIWEVEGTFTSATEPPKFTEPPDLAKTTGGAGSAISRSDPNKEDAREKSEAGVTVLLLTSGGVNIGRVTTTDPESAQRLVQARPKDKPSGKIGKWWMGPDGDGSGPFAPGKYRVSLCLKWVDPQKFPAPQQLSLRVLATKGEPLLADPVVFVTPDYPNPPKGAIPLGERDHYRLYELGTVAIKQSEHLIVDGTATTTVLGAHTLLAEKIKIELVEKFSDRQLEESQPCPGRPDGLPRPNGAKPQKVLFVKGMFWKHYWPAADKALDASYEVPSSYADLYRYDTVVLCNVSPTALSLAVRKMLKEFVQDGGRLVLLGGCFTTGHGGILKSYLDDVLPVDFQAHYQVVLCSPPVLLGPERNQSFAEKPAVFGLLRVTPRDKAATLAWGGPHPLAVAGTYGNGKVVVFAGTVFGESAGGLKAFWETAAWSKLFQRMVLEE